MAGRPPEPVPRDKADEIIAWIAEGKPLAEWCRKPGNPAYRTVSDWRQKDGTKTVTADMVQHRKLRIETRLKLLACWDPRRYGPKAVAPEPPVEGDVDLWKAAASTMPGQQ